jgi:hypothetical protein
VIAAEVKEVVDRVVRREEALRLSRRFEALHLPLASSGRLPEAIEGKSRLFGQAPVPRDADAVAEQVRAMRARFAAEGGDDALETSLLDEASLTTLRERIAAARRRLEDIGDRLRELNGSARVAVADDVLDWLRGETVI